MSENNTPKIINKSGTLKMTDETAAKKVVRDISGKKLERRKRRDRVRADVTPKEFDEITIAVDRVSRTVAGGRRMRFKALVAIGNHKNKVGVAVAKGNDVTTAVAKATSKAKKSMITFPMDQETICHEVEIKIAGAHVLMKPSAPGTGVIAGGVVRSIMGLTGIKNLISKSLGSANKVNIAYAVIEGLKQQVPRKDWLHPQNSSTQIKTSKIASSADTQTIPSETVPQNPYEDFAVSEPRNDEREQARLKVDDSNTMEKTTVTKPVPKKVVKKTVKKTTKKETK